ncbi:hypothetical protein [Lyngbya aestuarii]
MSLNEVKEPTPYLYPGRRWDASTSSATTWTPPVKFTGLNVLKLNI